MFKVVQSQTHFDLQLNRKESPHFFPGEEGYVSRKNELFDINLQLLS